MRTASTAIPNRVRTSLGVALAATALIAFAGCSDDDDKPTAPGGGGPTTSSFTGFMTDGEKSGAISLTVNSTTLAGRPRALGAAGHDITASASITFDGATFTATGTYNDEADSLNLTGGGYTFAGEFEDSPVLASIAGAFTGPNSGFWAVGKGTMAGSAYCGKWHSAADSDSGTWNIVTFGDVVGGVAYSPGGEPLGFIGTLSGTGTTRTITAFDGDPAEYELTVDGTLNTATGEVSGTWIYDSHDPAYGTDDNGTWDGMLCP